MRRVFVLLLAVTALGALYVFAGRAPAVGEGGRAALLAAGRPIVTPSPMPAQAAPTVTPWVCVIRSGVDGGRVNLRACGSTSCPVVSVLTEGDPLTVIKPGAWAKVRTSDNLTGYVYSKFCQ
jgi:hypothetical protein